MADLLEWGRARARAAPLRLRLVAILLALALVALLVTAATAVTLLRGQLIGKVDAQVSAVARGVANGGPLTGLGGAPERRGQLPTTQYAVLLLDNGDQVQLGRRLNPAVPAPDLSEITPHLVRLMHGRAFTVEAVDGSVQWRCVALRITGTQAGDVTLVVAQSLADVGDTVARMRAILAVVGFVVLLALGVLGWAVVRRALRPLTEVESVARTIAGGDLSRRVPQGPASTEVGRLAESLNSMLSQIEHAFAVREASELRMRRFVSDASHELRTPLATVRGYAELYRQGAVSKPEEIATAMRRIETEAARMGALVEDLLTLARLDEQRPEQRAPVDLTVLAADAVHDARALDPGREVRLSALHGQLGAVVVQGDESRLRQVVTNLVANALRHTPAGCPIELLVGVQDGSGLLQVRDHGPGIAPEQVSSVFERFFRADPSRGRGRGGGSGLGLAIVAAIVASHHGQVGVSQTPGGGATFLVRLPLAAAPVPGEQDRFTDNSQPHLSS